MQRKQHFPNVKKTNMEKKDLWMGYKQISVVIFAGLFILFPWQTSTLSYIEQYQIYCIWQTHAILWIDFQITKSNRDNWILLIEYDFWSLASRYIHVKEFICIHQLHSPNIKYINAATERVCTNCARIVVYCATHSISCALCT